MGVIDSTIDSEDGASHSHTKRRSTDVVKPVWLRTLPSPARSDTVQKSFLQASSQICSLPLGSDSYVQTASLRSYREQLQARGNEVIRCSRLSPKASSVSKSGTSFLGAASDPGDTELTSLSTSVGGSPPGSPVLPVKIQPMGAAPTSPHNLAPTCGSMASFGMAPVGMMGIWQPMPPQASPHGLIMSSSDIQPVVPSQMKDFWPQGCPVSTSETSSMQCSTFEMMIMSGFMPDGHVVDMEESRGCVSSVDEMMLTLLPDGPVMDMEKLVAQLHAAAPCCYDD